MERIEEKILIYDRLPVDEQAAVRAYVAAHPEIAEFFEAARVWERLCEEARLFGEEPPGDEALAYFVATRQLGPHALPETLQPAFQQVRQQLEADPGCRARYEAFVQRMHDLEAGSDARSQFERLTGHVLDAPSEATSSASILSYRTLVKWPAAAAAVIVVLYGSLFIGSRQMRSDLARLAVIDREEMMLEGYVDLRGGGQEVARSATSSDSLYLRALSALEKAQESTFGLFPRLDAGRLREAAGLLEQVVEQEYDQSFLELEAYFLLGKVRLGLNDMEGGRQAFQAVIQGQGRKAPEAAAILEQLSRNAR